MLIGILRRLFLAAGWQADTRLPASAYEQCVLIAAPHTFLLDGLITQAGFDLCGVRIRMAVADKYAFWPLKPMLESLGAIWINRSPGTGGSPRSQTDEMVELFNTNKKLCLVIAPEGRRALSEQWKTGFYHIAKQAGVPICLGYLDFERKLAGVGAEIWPTDDMEADMKKIMAFYSTITPCYTDKFSLDVRYLPEDS